MPKQSIDFSKTVIYKIQHKELDDLLYVGSTTEYVKRKNRHKTTSYANDTNKNYNLKLYKTIRDNGGWDMFNMIIVKPFPCENRRQAEAEEDCVMREMRASLNMRRSYQTQEELTEHRKKYYLEHIEDYRQWRLENNDKIKEKRREYYLENQDEIKEKSREYRLENTDKIKEQKREHYLKNQDEINAKKREHYHKIRDKLKEKFECPCGGRYSHEYRTKHFKTKLHQNFLKNNL